MKVYDLIVFNNGIESTERYRCTGIDALLRKMEGEVSSAPLYDVITTRRWAETAETGDVLTDDVNYWVYCVTDQQSVLTY